MKRVRSRLPAAEGVTDGIIPLFFNTFMPEWFVTIFLVILMAAGMSTISSQFHTMGTAVGRDVFGSVKQEDKKGLGGIARRRFDRDYTHSGTFVCACRRYGTVPSPLRRVCSSACAGAAFLPMYAGALYSKKMTKTRGGIRHGRRF